MPEIILKNVSKSFGKTVAVEELNLQILDNSFVTLLGPSGCGKTTILRMIAGLETPTEGKISIGGRVVFDSERGISLAPDKRNVGFLFQNYALWPHMTVYQNIAFGLENMRWDRDRIKKRVDELLRMLRIDGPEVLFMDEPLSNLDAKLRMEMRTELKRLHRDTKSTFVYVTHDQQEAMTLSTMVCVIEKGRLQQYAPPLPMYKNPANLFVAEFLGNPAMNLIEGHLCANGEVSFGGMRAGFEASNAVTLRETDVVLGIRPEYIEITGEGKLEAKVYSTLPSGMETTVKLDLNGIPLTAVVFGDVDFPVDRKVRLRFDKAVLFDRQSGKNIANGTLRLH